MNENTFKIINICSLLIAILLYHSFNYFKPENFDLLMIYKIVQYTVLSIGVILFVYSTWLAKLLYRKRYIGGRYSGTSQVHFDYIVKLESEGESIREPQLEKFEIKQNLFNIIISGKSLTEDGKTLISTWSGTLFKQSQDTYYFAIELDGSKGIYGMLKLTYVENEIYGIYYSANPESKNPFTLNAIKEK